MIMYDCLLEGLKKKQRKQAREDLASLILECGGRTITFSEDQNVGVYGVLEEGMIIFNYRKGHMRVWTNLNEDSIQFKRLLKGLDEIKGAYK